MKCAVIGVGNIGKRHIQSLASLEGAELVYHDIYAESLKSVEQFLKEQNLSFAKTEAFEDFEKFLDTIDAETVIIVATTADQRVETTSALLKKKPKAIILEKPVCQNMIEYEKLLAQQKETNVPVLVNFPRHMYPYYQKIHPLFSEEETKMTVYQAGGGLACNGIHIFDLASWLLDVDDFELVKSSLSEPYETKRPGYYDVSGKACFQSKKTKKQLEIIDSPTQECDSISITNKKRQVHIYEHLRKAIIVDKESIKEEDIEIPYQSQLSSKVVLELLEKGQSNMLPSLQESKGVHKMLFDMFYKDSINIKFT